MKKMMSKIWEKKNSKKGFTLVELIVVLVILAILMAIMIPAMTKWIDRAKEKQVMLEARTVVLAAQSAESESYGRPTSVICTDGEIKGYLDDQIAAKKWEVTVSKDLKTIEKVIYADGDLVVTYTPADGYKREGTAPSGQTVVLGK